MPMLYLRLFVLLALLAFAMPATAQDCTLASTAECNGVPCPDETRPEGRIIYNTDYSVAQICQDGIWVALHPFDAATSCPGAGLVGHWKLNESGSVSTAADGSPHGNDGTLTGFPADPSANWVTGKLGNALDFDGVDDYVDVSSFHPHSYNDFTFSAWYKSAQTAVIDDQYIWAHGDTTTAFADVFVFGPTDNAGQEDNLRLGLRGALSGHSYYYSSSDIVDQQWHHLAAVRTPTDIIIYVDGVEVLNTPDMEAGVTIAPDINFGPFIGDSPGNTEQVDGLIDDVRVYNRALDATEVSALYNGGAGCQ